MITQKEQHIIIRNSELSNEISQPQIIDFDISHSCTRRCSFCPQSITPMSGFIDLKVVKYIQVQMLYYNFKNIICLAGHGEPTEHPHFLNILELLNSTNCKHIELISNGDNLLNSKVNIVDILEFDKVKVTFSAYSRKHFKELEEQFGSIDRVIIKKMYTVQDLFWTNRGVFETDNPHINNYCYLPFYKLEVGVNGNYNLCCQDWSGEMSTNIEIKSVSYIDAWNTIYKFERDKQLEAKQRVNDVCKRCNIDGTLIGKEIFDIWSKDYDRTSTNTK